ncbi:hypothetical protein AA313_de0204558 [Arthrobotrys entomopaga]|nr:hypothetical protein AA313_de0204558 [Arthrobotrys entomopaga]
MLQRPNQFLFHSRVLIARDPAESSEDSFIHVERLKFYRSRVEDAIRSENFKDAEEFQNNIFGILLHQEQPIDVDWYMNGTTISYMLGDLEEANRRLASIPETMPIDPAILLKIYSLESAILIQRKEYDSAYTICKKVAKRARKAKFPQYMHLAYYFLQILSIARGNPHEADFYKQLVPENFELPVYAKAFEYKPPDFSSPISQSVEFSVPPTLAPIPADLPGDIPGDYIEEPLAGRIYTKSAVTQSRSMHRIIVGVDFGTTYSSIAWASPIYPGKSSSIIERARAPLQASSKLLDSYDSDIVRQINIPLGHDVMDVVTDYLHAMYLHCMEILNEMINRWIEIPQIDFVLAIPAVWNEVLRRELSNAPKMRDSGKGIIYEIFVVCDAGGGTVDIIAYQCCKVTPTVKLTKCASAERTFTGSLAINHNFQDFFKDRIGDDNYEMQTLQTLQTVAQNFEAVKCTFRDDPDKTIYNVDLLSIYNLPDAGIQNGQPIITRKEMRSFFDPTVMEIITLINNHLKELSERGAAARVNTIVLVGGFGESPYLFKRIVEWAGPYDINVVQPSDAATAVVRGAVLAGLKATENPFARIKYDTLLEEDGV